jgi:hypothetical protein
VKAWAVFLAAWAALDVLVNLRHPGPEPACWYFLPSLDVTVLLGAFALAGWRGWRVPGGFLALAAGLLIWVRLLRVADALVRLNYYRPVNLYLDLPLLPELARLLHSTVSRPVLVLGALLGLVALAATGLATHAALALARNHLAARRSHRVGFIAVVALGAILSPLWRAQDSPGLHHGLFGASVAPLMAQQARFALSARSLRRAKAAEIEAMQRRLQGTPAEALKRGKLQGADVLLVFIESYGAIVLDDDRFSARMRAAHESFAAGLTASGFRMASTLLESPTYGGGSWFAHATLTTGVRVGDGLQFAALRQTRPPPTTLASLLRQAGYRTVLVQPGTTRSWPEGLVHGFDRKYYAPDLEYQGPAFGWATMPDQYALGFVHQREMAPARRPVFIEYALVSSHAPWTLLPPLVEDWSRLDHGLGYRDLPPRRFAVTWEKLQDGGDALLASLIYDLQVLERYLRQLITRNTLVIAMGDHQPAGSLTRQAPSWAVPVHVISRDPSLIEAFVAAGYARGMRPSRTGAVRGMETFLPDLLQTVAGDHPP